ncbi:alpha/beta fold hydrolase [Psychrosphaera sp. F3M07]|uniref:alpha/beta fold hydrolase n=1 Tax=Psychrosphaera sp. F3M07 TaxID=2841560 RepID=UPI001C07EFB8|nr:alpha/beta fold hydrolase [Psychrosphaera sp. F3M07]MBU2918716.1 alpha/beta fold hydrolase [Psychrosphaera sp. F3M07]
MTIAHQVLGQGKPLIVIHGLFGTSDNLKQIAKSLSDQYKIYLIDAPAHGDSSTPDPLTLNNMAKAVLEFADQQGLTQFSLLGHSLGGKIAMEIALLENARVDKLIVADIAPVQYESRHNHILEGLNSINLDTLENRQQANETLSQFIDDVGVRGFLLKSLTRAEKPQSGWKWRFDLNALELSYENLIKGNSLLTYPGPTLYIIGGNSNYVLPEHKNKIVTRFQNTSVKVIQNAGHWLHAEKPTAFIKICRDFLA